MLRYFLLLLCFCCLGSGKGFAEKIKVACVGNSVTYGYLLSNRERDSYPSQLARMLGEHYEVRNFGKSGTTLLNRGHRPYVQQQEYRQAMDFAADMVVIHLGLNDTDPRDWPNYRDDFIPDYLALIDSFRRANPKCSVWVCRTTPIGHRHPRFKSGTRDWQAQIQRAIEKVAAVSGAGLIDLHEELYCHPNWFPDALHPDPDGAEVIAAEVYSAITGNFGGLQMPPVYSDNMVLQRGAELKIKGRADAGQKVEVRLGSKERRTVTDHSGHWEVVFKDVEAGGPYELCISTKDRKLFYKNVMIGEVWLCSGQSNMAFMVKQALKAEEAMAGASEARVRLFDMKPRAYTDAVSWDTADLAAINRLKYYLPVRWELPDARRVGDFSAVAYYFGRMLADSLHVTVGLICNAVGGAPAEAFIDRETLEFDYQLVDILYDWLHNDMIQDWVRERAALNMKNSPWKLQRHPYEPCYLYEAGIRPLQDFTIKGVVWYQGESNAHNVELHEALFPALVKSWRKIWGERMPFYFVQLSSLNRPSWPLFRDSQRRMAGKINHCGMVVCSDLGDPADVHPRQKKEVGERLARYALNATYDRKDVVPSGPLFRDAEFRGKEAFLSFAYGQGMRSSDGKSLAGFEIAGEDGIFHVAEAVVEGEKIKVFSPEVRFPCEVRYGWQPYSIGNLVNGVGLPASTFKTSE